GQLVDAPHAARKVQLQTRQRCPCRYSGVVLPANACSRGLRGRHLPHSRGRAI
ncbi:hypothetical protein AVDCRST_MAG82-1361, partial [uncultured Rubrobacteraceae bacterium]